jgi:PAS domain S-box-containing protein
MNKAAFSQRTSLQYLVAGATSALALVVTLLFPVIRQNAPVAFFFGAVTVSARIGGWRPALLCTCISAVLVDLYVLTPSGLSIGARELAIVSVFILISALMSTVVASKDRAERQASRSLERLQQMIESSNDAIITSSLDGIFLTWNAAAERTYGYSKEEAVGKHVSLIVPPEEQAEAIDEMELIKNGGRVPSHETIRVNKYGKRLTVSTSVSPVYDDDGNVTGLLRIVRDVTAEKEKAAELEKVRQENDRSLALLWSFMESAPVGFSLHDAETRFLLINDHLVGINGVPREETIGRTVKEALPALGPKLESHLREVFETGRSIEFEVEGDTLDPAKERYWIARYFPVQTTDGKRIGVGTAVLDITERKKAESVLRQTERLAAVGRLAASVAHEINNPLEAISNLVFLARTRAPANDSLADYLRMADEELRRVSHLTHQTLAFYRDKTSPGPVQLRRTIDHVVAMYSQRAKAKNVTVVLESEAALQIYSLEGEIRQVVANLYSNALDAVGTGGTVKIRTSVCSLQGRTGVRITVADNGAGISDQQRRSIWNAFYTTKEDIGTGLGLWVTREIVAKHNGTIKMRSRTAPQTGTVFSVFFPSMETTAQAAAS